MCEVYQGICGFNCSKFEELSRNDWIGWAVFVRDAFKYNNNKRIQCIQKATSSKAIQECLRSDPR